MHFILILALKLAKVKNAIQDTPMNAFQSLKKHEGINWPWVLTISNTKNEKVKIQNKFECYPVSSYSYLGYMHDQEVQEYAIEIARKYTTGNHGARMMGGNVDF